MTHYTWKQLRDAGKVVVGEWGFGSVETSGCIICRPADRSAVQAAYDAIAEGDLGPDVLDDVFAAGGEFAAVM